MIVQKCDGDRCNEKGGDDLADPVESFRWQNCDYDDDAGPFKSHDVCEDCRVAGLATGSFIILSLFAAVPAIVMIGIRFKGEWDNFLYRLVGIVLHAIILVFELIAVSVYCSMCFDHLGDFYSDDDTVDKGDVEYLLGPGLIANIVVLLFQPFLIAIHASLSHIDSGDEGGAGWRTGGGSMAAHDEI